MAVPASFPESNMVLGKPADMTHDQCDCLSVMTGTDENGLPVVISCWKVTENELLEIQRTGRIWLGVVGASMPPAWISGIKPFGDSDGEAPGRVDETGRQDQCQQE